MVTVHAAQAVFLAKQMVLCAIGLGLSTVSSEHCSLHDSMCIHQLAFKKQNIKLNCTWTLICQNFLTKLSTICISQTFSAKVLLYSMRSCIQITYCNAYNIFITNLTSHNQSINWLIDIFIVLGKNSLYYAQYEIRIIYYASVYYIVCLKSITCLWKCACHICCVDTPLLYPWWSEL